MGTLILTILALAVATEIGRRHGYQSGYRAGCVDTNSLYHVLIKRAELSREGKETEDG